MRASSAGYVVLITVLSLVVAAGCSSEADDAATTTVPASTTTTTNPFAIGDRSDDEISDICKEMEENYTHAVSAAETRRLWYVTSSTVDGSVRVIDDVAFMMPGIHLSGAQELGCDWPQTVRTP